MGNYISCTMLGPIGRQAKCAMVILPTGEIRHFYEQVNAAELMLEYCPNHFLVNTKSLHVGRRFSLGADEELQVANVYAAFAMKRATSLVTAADMRALFLTAAAKNKRAGRGSAKVLPADYCMEGLDDGSSVGSLPKLKLDDIEDFSAPDFKRRLSMCRSKKPLLDTIAE